MFQLVDLCGDVVVEEVVQVDVALYFHAEFFVDVCPVGLAQVFLRHNFDDLEMACHHFNFFVEIVHEFEFEDLFDLCRPFPGIFNVADERIYIKLIIVLVVLVINLHQLDDWYLLVLIRLEFFEYPDNFLEVQQTLTLVDEFIQRLHLVLIDFGAEQCLVFLEVPLVLPHICQSLGLLLSHGVQIQLVDL